MVVLEEERMPILGIMLSETERILVGGEVSGGCDSILVEGGGGRIQE